MKETVLAILSLQLIAIATLHAQAPTGAVVGLITDPTGAAVSGARITITNQQTAAQRSVIASSEGGYSMPALLAGVYQVTAEAAGFRQLMLEVIVEIGSTTTVNLTMQVGPATDRVTVEGAFRRCATTRMKLAV